MAGSPCIPPVVVLRIFACRDVEVEIAVQLRTVVVLRGGLATECGRSRADHVPVLCAGSVSQSLL